jgi:hypothetical protein
MLSRTPELDFLQAGDKKIAQDEMLISLRVNYLGDRTKRVLHDLAFMKPTPGSSSYNAEHLGAIFTTDYLREAKTSTESFQPDLLNAHGRC